WELSTKTPPNVITGYDWELYNVDEDPTEYKDLAAKMPDKLKELQDLFYSEARKYNVLPLDNSTLARWNTPRPSLTAGRTQFTLGKGGTGVLSVDAEEVARNTLDHTTPITFPEDESFDVGLDTRTGIAMVEYRLRRPVQVHRQDRQADV